MMLAPDWLAQVLAADMQMIRNTLRKNKLTKRIRNKGRKEKRGKEHTSRGGESNIE